MLQTITRFLIPALCCSVITSFAETSEEKANAILEKANETLEKAQIKASEAAESAAEAKKIADSFAPTDVGGFNFSVGIGYEMYRSPYIKKAKLRGTVGTDQTVAVTDSYKGNTSLWLTTNYIWDGDGAWLDEYPTINPGFYVGARIAGDDSNAFDAIGFGLMLAFKRNTPSSNSTFNSLNIGIGGVWHRTQELAYGIKEGSPLPSYYSDIEYKKKDEFSVMMILSVGFN